MKRSLTILSILKITTREMKLATIKQFNKIRSIFKKYKKVFPHIRMDYLKRQIKSKNVIFEKEVVLIKGQYQRKVNLGNKTFDKGTFIIHQIANGHQGNGKAKTVLNKFINSINNKIILTVRKSNIIARRFYERNYFKKVGKIFWLNNKIEGVIYERR
jgi:RimJ/RimL family protein N-acetyltransferase